MSLHSKVHNLTRNCRIRQSQAKRMVENGLAEWVRTDAIRELDRKERLERWAAIKNAMESGTIGFPCLEPNNHKWIYPLMDRQASRELKQSARWYYEACVECEAG